MTINSPLTHQNWPTETNSHLPKVSSSDTFHGPHSWFFHTHWDGVGCENGIRQLNSSSCCVTEQLSGLMVLVRISPVTATFCPASHCRKKFSSAPHAVTSCMSIVIHRKNNIDILSWPILTSSYEILLWQITLVKFNTCIGPLYVHTWLGPNCNKFAFKMYCVYYVKCYLL